MYPRWNIKNEKTQHKNLVTSSEQAANKQPTSSISSCGQQVTWGQQAANKQLTSSQQAVAKENIKTKHNKKARLPFGTNGLYHVELPQFLFGQVLNKTRFQLRLLYIVFAAIFIPASLVMASVRASQPSWTRVSISSIPSRLMAVPSYL